MNSLNQSIFKPLIVIKKCIYISPFCCIFIANELSSENKKEPQKQLLGFFFFAKYIFYYLFL